MVCIVWTIQDHIPSVVSMCWILIQAMHTKFSFDFQIGFHFSLKKKKKTKKTNETVYLGSKMPSKNIIAYSFGKKKKKDYKNIILAPY